MVNKQRNKGLNWERQFVKLLEENIEGTFKRIAGSGSIGTAMGEPLLTGDIRMRIPGYPKEIRIEAKTGYGGSTQLAIKKAWFDKIREEAENSYAVPMISCKFSDAKKGVKYFVAFDFEAFVELMNHLNNLTRELDLVYEKIKKNG